MSIEQHSNQSDLPTSPTYNAASHADASTCELSKIGKTTRGSTMIRVNLIGTAAVTVLMTSSTVSIAQPYYGWTPEEREYVYECVIKHGQFLEDCADSVDALRDADTTEQTADDAIIEAYQACLEAAQAAGYDENRYCSDNEDDTDYNSFMRMTADEAAEDARNAVIETQREINSSRSNHNLEQWHAPQRSAVEARGWEAINQLVREGARLDEPAGIIYCGSSQQKIRTFMEPSVFPLKDMMFTCRQNMQIDQVYKRRGL